MADARTLAEISESNPVLLLLRRKHRGYAMEVAHRVFRDEFALSAPLDRFVRICDKVRDELYSDDVSIDRKRTSMEQLEHWCDRAKGEPWFLIQDDIRNGKTVALRPAAREALTIALNASEQVETVSDSNLASFFDNLTKAAAHLRQDHVSLYEKLRAERDALQQQMDELEAHGVSQATANDRQGYASNMTHTIRTILSAVGQLPPQLRDNLSQATDTFYSAAEGESHGHIVRDVIAMLNKERDRASYRVMDSLARLHTDEPRRVALVGAVETIIDHCDEFMSYEARQEARNFFEYFTDLALRAVSEDQQASHRVSSFVEDATFERRMGQSRRLIRLAELMRDAARTTSISHKNGAIPFGGFTLDYEQVAKKYWFDFRLTTTPPAAQEDPPVIEEADQIDPAVAQRAIQEAAAKEAFIDPRRLARRAGKLVERFGEVPLSAILANTPPRYEVEEIAAYLQAAMSVIPAEFRPGWEMELEVDNADDEGHPQRVRCADPVFVRSGQPGHGLDACSHTLIAEEMLAVTTAAANSQDSEVRQYRPAVA